MSAERCTLGPWSMVQWGDGSGSDTYIVTSDPAQAVIASGLLRAEATLIASAPDMLDALRMAEQLLALSESRDGFQVCGADLRLIQDVIARAEGAQPHRRSVR